MTTTHIPERSLEYQGDAGPCCHHWVIEAPDGPVSLGSCRVCGETREFKNFIESAPWRDESRESASQNPVKITVPDDYVGDLDDQ